MDITTFVAFDKVSSKGVLDLFGLAALYDVTAFLETIKGYLEAGYAYTDGRDGLKDQRYHNMKIAFSRRYGGFLPTASGLSEFFARITIAYSKTRTA